MLLLKVSHLKSLVIPERDMPDTLHWLQAQNSSAQVHDTCYRARYRAVAQPQMEVLQIRLDDRDRLYRSIQRYDPVLVPADLQRFCNGYLLYDIPHTILCRCHLHMN